jgi:hypothetical protein
MSNRSVHADRKFLTRAGVCLLGTAALALPFSTFANAEPGFDPVIYRGTSTAPASNQLRLAYQATFPSGSLDASPDMLNVGPMQVGDTLVPDSNPTFEKGPGDIILGITRPVGLDPELIVAQSVWATGLNFGPGSVVRIRATFIAPAGPIPGGGFAIGLGAKTGGRDDLASDTRVFTTINVRPNFLVRLNVPFGSVETTNTVLPAEIKNMIFSATDPQPFTLELTIDRVHGTGQSKLTVGDKIVGPLSFHLSDFLRDSGPSITAAGPGIAVNSNGPGKTASVRVREFRIYTNAGG